MTEIVEPAENEHGRETHPAWGMIAAHRVQSGPPGHVLFDSDVRHQHFMTLTISEASRSRTAMHDHLMAERETIEIAMSESQWAAFVSSVNAGQGVPCTVVRLRGEGRLPGMPFESRLRESMKDVRGAADEAFEEVWDAFEEYKAKKNAANLRTLEFTIRNAAPNIEFAGESLVGHTEKVVQKARADIEAMVAAKASQLGLRPGDLGGTLALGEGEDE